MLDCSFGELELTVLVSDVKHATSVIRTYLTNICDAMHTGFSMPSSAGRTDALLAAVGGAV